MSKTMELARAYADAHGADMSNVPANNEARDALEAYVAKQEDALRLALDILQRLCSHGTRTSAQIDADWDAARAAITAIKEAQE